MPKNENVEVLIFHYLFWLKPTSKMLLKHDYREFSYSLNWKLNETGLIRAVSG